MTVADAGISDAYAGAVPAQIVLACGVFGNVGDDDLAGTVRQLPGLCAPGATVIWTRHRRAPDLTPAVRAWFRAAGFDELAFVAPDGATTSVGAHRLRAAPAPFERGRRFFRFVDEGADATGGSPTGR